MTLYLQNLSDYDKTVILNDKLIKIEKGKEIQISNQEAKSFLNSKESKRIKLTISTKSILTESEKRKKTETKSQSKQEDSKSKQEDSKSKQDDSKSKESEQTL